MNKNKKRKNRRKEKKFIPYTKKERQQKINCIYLQLMNKNIYEIIPKDVKNKINCYIDTGEEYVENIYLEDYGRMLEINLTNNKNINSENMIKLTFKKIIIEGEGKDNPIHKLNKIQEELIN